MSKFFNKHLFTNLISSSLRLVSSRFYYLYIIILASVLSFLNWENQMMGGIVWYYEDFARFIASGFSDDYQFKSETPAFPMWGYGFIIFLLKQRSLIIVFQQCLNILSIYFIEKLLIRYGFKQELKSIYRLILLFSFSWFLFHTGYWPYSIAALLLTFSLPFLLIGLKEQEWCIIIYSALFYGLALNFKSDYLYYYFFLIPSLLLWSYIYSKQSLPKVVSWAAIVFFLMTPWQMHCYNKIGKAQMYSSNGGHHLFISLGQLPNNIWGITANDSDPLMRQIVDEAFPDKPRTVSHYADTVLRNEWKKRVLSEPGEYFKKCLFNLYSMITRPFTHGEVYRTFIKNELKRERLKSALKQDIQAFKLLNLTKIT